MKEHKEWNAFFAFYSNVESKHMMKEAYNLQQYSIKTTQLAISLGTTCEPPGQKQWSIRHCNESTMRLQLEGWRGRGFCSIQKTQKVSKCTIRFTNACKQESSRQERKLWQTKAIWLPCWRGVIRKSPRPPHMVVVGSDNQLERDAITCKSKGWGYLN